MAWIEKRKRADGSTAWLVRAEKKADGERSKGASRSFKTKAEAKQYAGQLDGLGAGAGFSRGSAGEYIARWLEWLETSEAVRPNTLSGYRSKLAGVTFAHKPLARVTAQDVREWLQHLKEVGGVAGRPLSKSSIGQARAILHKCLAQAITDGVLASNPVSGAALPKMAKRRRPSVLTEAQAKDYLAALDETGDGDFFRMAVLTGLRRSEIGGLSWSAIDLDAGTLEVRRTLIRVPKSGGGVTYAFSEPKTEHSRRMIRLSAAVVEVLRRRRARIAEDRLAAGGAWAENDLVFCNALGEPESLDRLSMVARRVKDRLGLPSTALPVHGLRHLVGAAMNRAGKDAATIRDQLGHSDVRTTLQFYVTVDDDQRQESADLLGDLFG